MSGRNSIKLNTEFLQGENVSLIAMNLLGKVIMTRIGSEITGGMIVETEAYSGVNDKACHANNGLRTRRTEVMYRKGGHIYVYLCYGIHHMLNIVTNKEGKADAVLIRALQPLEGVDIIRSRRDLKNKEAELLSGPGKLTKGLGIDMSLNFETLKGNIIWMEEGKEIPLDEIERDRRIGVQYAGEDALKPWRFFIKNSKYVSYQKQKDCF